MIPDQDKEMTSQEAIRQDTEFYADLDEDTDLYCVFGDSSGFAYHSFSDGAEAKRIARRMNSRRGGRA